VIDCVYIAAASYDSRFTRICVASVRFFYPNIPIRLLIGGRVSGALVHELHRLWGVEVASVEPGEYGWGFVKLEPLFLNSGKRFLVLDSDTVLVGPVLNAFADCAAPFLVDDESQTEDETRRLYYDWQKVRSVDPAAAQPRFVFNSGQWFGTSGTLQREDFSPWIDWSMPRALRHPELFMPGDQGILNYVLNKNTRHNEALVARRKIMRWPGHTLDDLKIADIGRPEGSPFGQIVHWAGFKAPRLESLPRADLLLFFERFYYKYHGGGEPLRLQRSLRAGLEFRLRRLTVKFRQRVEAMRAQRTA